MGQSVKKSQLTTWHGAWKLLTLREIHVWHMIIPYWIVQNQLVISIAPIVADARVPINNEGIDSKHLETCCNGETALAGTCAVLDLDQIGFG